MINEQNDYNSEDEFVTTRKSKRAGKVMQNLNLSDNSQRTR